MLPTTSVNSRSQGNGALSPRDAARHTAGAKRYKYLRRLFHFRQMDFEFALWQMLYLFTSPQRVYRNFHYRKQTKDQWARDDPAFLVILSIWLCVSTVGFGFVLDMGFFETIKLLLWVVFIDCIGVGLLIATLMWFISNKYLVKQQNRDYDVEWGYAFDVHLNAFYPLLVILHFIQLFFINYVIISDSVIGYFVGNTLWLIAIGYYVYVTFLGYSAGILAPSPTAAWLWKCQAQPVTRQLTVCRVGSNPGQAPQLPQGHSCSHETEEVILHNLEMPLQ
ncbi:protein unc-50 homolog isoform X1 [Aptenodytes patagonicus]|uniref:protein unc-50 homolog isoform X1 n=1 Tax=Aptenodytes patagonicus TaxID=9234 RepID=UPI003F9F75B2